MTRVDKRELGFFSKNRIFIEWGSRNRIWLSNAVVNIEAIGDRRQEIVVRSKLGYSMKAVFTE